MTWSSAELWAAAEESNGPKYEEAQSEDGDQDQVDRAVRDGVGETGHSPGLDLEREGEVAPAGGGEGGYGTGVAPPDLKWNWLRTFARRKQGEESIN